MDINAKDNGRTGFYSACENGHAEIVNLLLATDDVDINTKDEDGVTGFHHACWNGHTEIINLLLSGDDVDINAKDEDGRTGFHLACENGHAEIVNLLLSRDDVDINTKDEDDRTGFHEACENGLYTTSPRLVVEMGVQICFRYNMHPTELLGNVNSKIIEEIQTSISRKQQKSARK
eukprot:CAMPEP_0206193622 /NCGR_PEP_ID=MMETSP0166-20121206/6679_1 /ASSEMBLY_ACC=CAM_ASM_000260 /TAXON_ID=95228 /ORGANISM="Vannella robusta, Strain DIVA3 518/3/11/1/6" /LENGTH=175 /DNA_ID=CAMNT_0053610375 /DNA_START=226 /DNA_END=753 /DNA_ORIENTATION=-